MIENLTICPKAKHDERRARQRQARNLKNLARLEYLNRLVSEPLPYQNEFGYVDPTPPEAVKLIWTEIRKLERKIILDGGQLERLETGLQHPRSSRQAANIKEPMLHPGENAPDTEH